MTINLPKDLESSIRAEVLSGHFPSEDDLVAAAVRAFLRPQPKQIAELTVNDRHSERTNEELQQRLLKAGLISEIKPPITDLTPYQNRQAIAVQGEPLSETVIRERR
jgi:Arc/MetJ-type ribon-helix-helix transcriptional regulator